MNNSSDEIVMRDDDAVEALLEDAVPRPAPPAQDEKMVRDAVHAEWQAVTGRHRTRQRMTYFAIAATVVLGIAVTFNALQVADIQAVPVATISKSHGSIYLLGEQSELHEMRDLSSITVGQVIETADNAGIGLEWGSGGSLRVDQNTRIEFKSTELVYLYWGRIYFDSQPSQLVAAITGSGFEIQTEHGSIKHLGTQFMTGVDSRDLTVSVREGEVEVDGAYVNKAVAVAGKQLTISGGAQPSVLDIDGYGAAWEWIERTAPVANADGRTVDEFLTWAGRQTGLQVSYESDEARVKAHEGVLRGNYEDISPRRELELRMSGEDLGYRIDGGTIYVSTKN